ncbi:MAG: vancomycin resistance protein [Bacteroidetes bacterium]|nr:MAG: vancomycin resistance protein [Bacteroidota bacterium]
MNTWKTVKQHIRHFLRTADDLRTGQWQRFAQPGPVPGDWPETHRIEQAITPSSTLEQKQQNIRLAGTRINRICVLPGQTFSFWSVLGAPSVRKGYQASRNIVAGRLALEAGGGLCQVAGLLYHLALSVGLDVQERHAHSMDIYTEEERYTPLGSDAAVVFGYKDLRIANTSTVPFAFRLEQHPERVTGSVLSPVPMPVYRLEFLRTLKGDREIVQTIRHMEAQAETVCWSHYQKLPASG